MGGNLNAWKMKLVWKCQKVQFPYWPLEAAPKPPQSPETSMLKCPAYNSLVHYG